MEHSPVLVKFSKNETQNYMLLRLNQKIVLFSQAENLDHIKFKELGQVLYLEY